MVRDEAHNLRHNLPLWGPGFFDAYVIAVDSRTVDDTRSVLDEILPAHVPRHIFDYTFDGFGPARTLVFSKAWEHFPDISHVLVADPDWRPNANLINKADLDFFHDSYQIKIWDRNGLTTRYCNWLMRHQPGLRYDYYVHELLRFPDGGPVFETQKITAWEVAEAESDHSWHQTVGHGAKKGASRTYKRFLFDIALLEREQASEQYRDSPHTLYYLGAAHCALVESSEEDFKTPLFHPGWELSPTQRKHADTCMYNFKRRMEIHGTEGDPNREMTWGTLRWLGYNSFYLLRDLHGAEQYYLQCIAFDRERTDCKYELSKLYTWKGDDEEAYKWALESVLTPMPMRSFANNFYLYDCLALVQASRAAVNAMTDQPTLLTFETDPKVPAKISFDPKKFALGHFLGVKAARQCVDGFPLERTDVLQQLANAYNKVWQGHVEGEWDKVLSLEDMCFDKDGSYETLALLSHDGEHYLCENSVLAASDSELTYTPLRQMADNNFQSPMYLDVKQFHSGKGGGAVGSALYLVSELTSLGSVRAACDMAKSMPQVKFLLAFSPSEGTSDEAVIAEYAAFVKSIGVCKSPRVQGMLLEKNFGLLNLGGKKFDYVSLGAGLLNLDVVGENTVEFLKEIVGLLNPGGGFGVLVHNGEKVTALLKQVDAIKKHSHMMDAELVRELYEKALVSSFGYSSASLLRQVEHIRRGFTVSELARYLGQAGLAGAKLISYGSGKMLKDGAHFEAFASTMGGTSPTITLNEESIMAPKADVILRAAERQLRRTGRGALTLDIDMPTGTLQFPYRPLYVDLLGMLNKNKGRDGEMLISLKDMYSVCNNAANRKSSGMQALTMEAFMKDAISFAETLNELGLIAII
jgi:hypothetical protein